MMDTIDNFLDAMFAPYPASTRLTDAKVELRAMMEDAYADAIASGMTHNEAVGRVITDFGNLQEIAPVLGIADDLTAAKEAPQPEATPARSGTDGTGTPSRPRVTLPEAQELAEARRRGAASLGRSVAILVSTGIPMFALRGLTEVGLVPFNEETATFLALGADLLLVALGVIMLLSRSRLFANVKHLVNLEFTPDPIVTAWAARLRLEHEDRRMRRLTIAVGLWICAALPLAVVQALPPIGIGMDVPVGADNGTLNGGKLFELALALSVALVALGLWIFLPANWAVQTQQTLIREGHQEYDYDEENYRDPVIGIVASVYWPCVVVAYFVWGAVFDQWDKSWVLFPISGLLFGVFAAVRTSVRRAKAGPQ
ncbi:MAG: permease prefix domain 1-containing protein [Schaalia odontolytica]